MRAFVGTDFEGHIKSDIAKIQSLVRENSTKGRFKYIGNFHLTLKFLGEIEDKKIPLINRALQEAAQHYSEINVKIDSIGYFHGKDSIHALWLGLGWETDALRQLQGEIDSGLHKIGFKRESKEYVPHITIAQDLVLKIPFEQLKEQIDFDEFKPIEIKRLELIKSEEKEGKRIYTPVSTFTLQRKK